MSSGKTAAGPFPIRFADIIFAEVLDPNRHNPKTRRVVVLTSGFTPETAPEKRGLR